MQYLANKYDAAETLYPQEPELRARVDQMLFFDLNLFAKIREYYFAKRLGLPCGDPLKLKGLEQQFEFLEIALDGQDYVAGDQITIADFSLVSSVVICEKGSFPLENYPNVSKWLELCKETVPGIVPDEEAFEVINMMIQETMQATEEAGEGDGEVAEEAAEDAAAEEEGEVAEEGKEE